MTEEFINEIECRLQVSFQGDALQRRQEFDEEIKNEVSRLFYKGAFLEVPRKHFTKELIE